MNAEVNAWLNHRCQRCSVQSVIPTRFRVSYWTTFSNRPFKDSAPIHTWKRYICPRNLQQFCDNIVKRRQRIHFSQKEGKFSRIYDYSLYKLNIAMPVRRKDNLYLTRIILCRALFASQIILLV